MAGRAAGALSRIEEETDGERYCELAALVSIAMGVSAVATLLDQMPAAPAADT